MVTILLKATITAVFHHCYGKLELKSVYNSYTHPWMYTKGKSLTKLKQNLKPTRLNRYKSRQGIRQKHKNHNNFPTSIENIYYL